MFDVDLTPDNEKQLGDLLAFFVKLGGIESMERSFARLQTKRIDLMQVHNLVDVETQLATMRDWKAQGRFKYIGITYYNSSAFAEVEKVLRREKLDFLQINYSIQERDVAVIINRPFGGGDVFGRVRAKPLPDWAAECNCHSWAQLLLKWIFGSPAVTCAIPATNNPTHLQDNMAAGRGRMPDTKTRQRIMDLVSSF